ncbi:MAG: hypothetical protein A2234_07045 [Elusimicrobia bacterium RIFOXYA2_FULL_58_8]|nr:MAG: hypothetical protein A2234_07045 [Elusimicrobia bacterium RIFOXYA2_FULL_58_8]
MEADMKNILFAAFFYATGIWGGCVYGQQVQLLEIDSTAETPATVEDNGRIPQVILPDSKSTGTAKTTLPVKKTSAKAAKKPVVAAVKNTSKANTAAVVGVSTSAARAAAVKPAKAPVAARIKPVAVVEFATKFEMQLSTRSAGQPAKPAAIVKPAAVPAAAAAVKPVPVKTPGAAAAPALAAVKPAVVAGAAENGGFAVDKMHKVSGGDTLWGLSGKYYSDPYKWGKIYNANLNTVENPDRIYPREELIIPGITEEVSPVRKAPVAISGSDTVTEGDLSVTEVKPAAVPAAARKKASARSVVMSDDLDSFARNDLSAEMPKDQKEWSVFTKVVPDDWEADGVVTAREHTSSDSVDEGLSFSGETVVIKRSGSVQVREGDYFTIYLTGAAAFDKRGKNIGRELQPAGTAEVVSVKGRVVKARIVDASTTIRKGMVVKINVRS